MLILPRWGSFIVKMVTECDLNESLTPPEFFDQGGTCCYCSQRGHQGFGSLLQARSSLWDFDNDYVLGLETPSRGWSAITPWSPVLSWVSRR